jgi:hypothetical protein
MLPPSARPPGPAHANPQKGPVGRLLAAIARGLEGTPGRLRLAAGAAIVAAIVAGLGSGFALQQRAAALDDAQDSAANLVLLQGVRTNLGQADADAANAFLRFGLEPAAQQQDYATSLRDASVDLAAAARGADAADAALLGQVNDKLTQYAGLVEAARANNRQGLPVGASYLTVASELLRGDILTTLDQVADHEQDRTDDALGRAGTAVVWLILAIVVGVGGLVAVQLWLARRSRRILNVPAAGATALLVVFLLVGGVLMAVAQTQANETRDDAYADVVSLGSARVSAFEAKSQEAVTLIKRGSGTPEDTEWREAYNEADNWLARSGSLELRDQLTAYRVEHDEIRALDNEGNWDGAVELATAQGEGSANAAFAAFADASRDQLAAAARDTDDGLAEAGGGLAPMAWVLILVGVLAAGGAWWGISLRLDEYR